MTEAQKPTPAASSTPPVTPVPRPAATEKRTFSVGQFLAGALFVLVVVFIFENTDDIKIRIIAGPKVTAPVWAALLGAAVAGALISALMRWRRKHKSSSK